jgi:hypothetical protein
LTFFTFLAIGFSASFSVGFSEGVIKSTFIYGAILGNCSLFCFL